MCIDTNLAVSALLDHETTIFLMRQAIIMYILNISITIKVVNFFDAFSEIVTNEPAHNLKSKNKKDSPNTR